MSNQTDNLDFLDQYSDQIKVSDNIEIQAISLDIITTDAAFYELKDEWNSLLNKSNADSIFLTWEWISTWWKYFNKKTDLWVITARQAETKQLIGIAPLAIKKIRTITGLYDQTLIFMGNGATAPDHLDFIILNGYENIVSQLFSEKLWVERYSWNQIRIEGLSSTSSVIDQLLQQHPHLLKKVDETFCPYLPLPDNWETLKESLSKNMRYNLGRFERRLEKDYPDVVNIRKINDPDEIKEYMSILVELHTASQQRKENVGLFTDQNIIDFHTEIAKVFLKKGWLRSYTLDVGSTSIAVLHCFQYKNTVSFYQSGFDQFWRRYSPGTQIMAHAIKEAIQENNKVFDFLRGEEDYKFKWTSFRSTNLTFTIPFSIQSQLGLQLKQLSRKLITDF